REASVPVRQRGRGEPRPQARYPTRCRDGTGVRTGGSNVVSSWGSPLRSTPRLSAEVPPGRADSLAVAGGARLRELGSVRVGYGTTVAQEHIEIIPVVAGPSTRCLSFQRLVHGLVGKGSPPPAPADDKFLSQRVESDVRRERRCGMRQH